MEHSQETYSLLQYISENHNGSLLDLINESDLPGSYTEKQALVYRLVDLGLVSMSGRGGNNLDAVHLHLTGSGVDLLFRTKEVTPLQEIAETLKNQVDELQKQVAVEQETATAAKELSRTAKEEAASAREDSRSSKVVSIISLLIGLAGIIVAILK